MESLNLGFWIGLTCAIPLSVAGNLLTPLVQRLWARRSTKRAARLASALRDELAEISRLAADPHQHQIFLMESVLMLTFLCAASGALIGFFYIAAQMVAGGPYAGWFRPSIVAVVCAVMVAKECVTTLRKSQRVKRFDAYRATLEVQLRGLES